MAEAPRKSDNYGNSSAKHSRTIAHCKCEHRLIARHATCPSSKCECALRLSNIHTQQGHWTHCFIDRNLQKIHNAAIEEAAQSDYVWVCSVGQRTGTLTKFAVMQQEKQKAAMTKPTILGK